ncbi:uncharacterized protein LOC124613798 [Schistocerca americana]|uniref:uncharacterized protein LOC124613798 n=1 Tax=Schistocerca americana TaxID=7009 RepID=UPI001F4FD73A|nr:uncharacterized protein LOC124613798 [Schistocerca americana]
MTLVRPRPASAIARVVRSVDAQRCEERRWGERQVGCGERARLGRLGSQLGRRPALGAPPTAAAGLRHSASFSCLPRGGVGAGAAAGAGVGGRGPHRARTATLPSAAAAADTDYGFVTRRAPPLLEEEDDEPPPAAAAAVRKSASLLSPPAWWRRHPWAR